MELLLGHLVGDYLLQNNWMALNKARKDLIGWLACTVHCLIYSMAVCVCTWDFRISWVLIVFLSHMVVDKFSIVGWYLHNIKGRSIKDCLDMIEFDIPGKNDVVQVSITCFVYIVCDNTLHLLLMFYGRKLLGS